ncbi:MULTISPECIES: alpha/beta hydrolase [unclassified Nocardioides]|uniref:alpha/beta hydrolase n=1 Tax=unclassified Nocardioides TaxID=2615069 RepID=UPI0000574C26|nr:MULTISPECIES: alpha/beta hydrolase [unclassified Nocardioides]ABL81167.1 Alpha/beta hydrolase fold-3 domain protein [Nocardioides sp. JS614]
MSPAPHPLQERIARRVMRTVGALPAPVQRAFAGRPIRIDGQQLHPEVQLALRLLHLAGGPTFETLPLAEGRAQISSEAWVFGDELPVETVRDLTLDGRNGPIPARLYLPSGRSDPAALLVYFHGGGWVLGGLDASDSACRFLADHAGIAVLSVDYRLAPEHRFPAAVEDAVDAFHAAVAAATTWGVDPAAIGVGGESAGGNLAAVVAQLTHAASGPEPACQLLFFPVTDLSTKHPSYALFSEGYFLTEAQMEWYRGHYLEDPAQALDPRVSPLLAEDLSGLCPAYVAVAGFDPLRDEGAAYAHRLQEAGVRVSLQRHSGLIHGIVNATGVGRSGREVLLQAAGALRIELGARAGSG